METREIPLEPGAFGWAVTARQYDLPKGLAAGTLVKVVLNRNGEATMQVKDREGGHWDLFRINVVPRLHYLHHGDGKWYPESSDRAQRILMEEIRKECEKLEQQKRKIEDLHWRVRRSGSKAAITFVEGLLRKSTLGSPD